MDSATFYTALAAWGTWATVLCAMIVLVLQNRSAKHLTCLQIFLQLVATYDSEEMNARRARLAKHLIDDRTTLEVDDAILMFFENVAYLYRKRLLDPELVFNTYGIDAMSYWEALRHYVEHVRSEFCDPSFYCEFEWFAKRMGEHERRRSETPNSLVGSDADAVDKFLRMEIRRGP